MEELGISMAGQSSKGLADVPIDEIDFVVSFDDADKRCAALPPRAKVERWLVTNPARDSAEGLNALATYRDGRDEIDKRVFALFLDHWRNIPVA